MDGGTRMVRQCVRFARRAVPSPLRPALRGARRALSYVPRRLLGAVTHVVTGQPLVALTFDDGPHPATTVPFAELLEKHGARGTFFLLGQQAFRYPQLVARLRAGGHAIGNHSWDHASFPAIPARERRRQLRAWSDAVGDVEPRLFRPPYGNQTLRSSLDPLWLGWTVVTWNVVARDWTGDGGEIIAARILERLGPGSIVLLHERLFRYEDVRYVPREATLDAVRRVLQAAGRRYRFVTVPELLELGRANREWWWQPGEAEYLARLQGEDEAAGDGNSAVAASIPAGVTGESRLIGRQAKY